MNCEDLKIDRQKLYEQVWSTPMSKLAKQYGLSDTGLRKVCLKHNVPVPKCGYWQKLQYGKSVKQPPLPDLQGNGVITIYKIEVPPPPVEDEFRWQVEEKIANERLPENRIIVSDGSSRLHPLVAQAKKSMHESFRHQGCMNAGRDNLDIRVGSGSVSRACRIMDALVRALEEREIRVFVDNKNRGRSTCVDVMGEIFPIMLQEHLQRVEVEGSFGPRSDYQPNGKLVLRIDKDYVHYRTRWSDGEKQRVEDCLNSFIDGLYKGALWERAARLERERAHKQWEEERRKREEKQRLVAAEHERVRILESAASSWHKSQVLRAYIEASVQAYIRQNGTVAAGGEFDQWRIWATQQADRMDPLVQSPPSILDEKII